MNEVIKTDKLNNFCVGCNNTVTLQRFIAIDEGQSLEDAIESKDKNKGDELFSREIFVGRCLCGNVFINTGI